MYLFLKNKQIESNYLKDKLHILVTFLNVVLHCKLIYLGSN